MLIIEDGTAKIDAQSYATEVELVAFAAARGIVLPATEAEREALLLAAADYMETLQYLGTRYSLEQALEWPRNGVYSEGWRYSYDTLPAKLKQAQLQLAVDAKDRPLLGNLTAATTGAVIEQTVEGAVSVKYAAPGTQELPGVGEYGVAADGTVLSRARALLRPLLLVSGIHARVGRG